MVPQGSPNGGGADLEGTGPAMEIDELLRYTVERGASDLHLKVGNVPFIRVDGALTPTEFDVLTPTDTETFATSLMSRAQEARVRRDERGRPGHTLDRRRPIPGERVPSAGRGGARDPARAQRGADVRGAPAARP